MVAEETHCCTESAKTQNADKGSAILHNAIQALTQVLLFMSLVFRGVAGLREDKFKQRHYFLHTNPTGPNSATFILLEQF